MTELRYNLLRHGYERCAQFVLGRLRDHRRMVYVYIAPNGDVHCNLHFFANRAPTLELIASYTRNAQPEMVEADLIHWLQQKSALAA